MIQQPEILVGTSEAARALDERIWAAARSDAKVLITGESGSGKEVAARLIHHRSARRSDPLVTVNCAGVPDSLLESELFGHVKGSFTGAYRDRPGLLEAANGGTVFLDEIGEMSPRMQAALLRFLETGELQRVGADRPTARLNVRVICATNRVLARRVAEGHFREDLYYRLNVINIHVPPLRERPDDLPALIDYFRLHYAERHGVNPAPELSDDVRARLLGYGWPGNIRELRNVMERLVVRHAGTMLVVADFGPEIPALGPDPGAVQGRDRPSDRQGADSAQVAPRVDEEGPEAIDRLTDTVARQLVTRVTKGGESFWAAVHGPFVARDLTRAILRRVVSLGLDETGGHYDRLAELLGVGPGEYKRFLGFLRKHDCLVPYQPFLKRSPAGGGTDEAEPQDTASRSHVA